MWGRVTNHLRRWSWPVVGRWLVWMVVATRSPKQLSRKHPHKEIGHDDASNLIAQRKRIQTHDVADVGDST